MAHGNGVRWFGTRSAPPGRTSDPYSLAGIAAAIPRYVAFLYAARAGMFHTAMKVLVSFNGGRTEWQTRQAPPPQGDVAGFAVAPGGFGVITIAVVTLGLEHYLPLGQPGAGLVHARDPGHQRWRDAELAAVHELDDGQPGDGEPATREPRPALDEGRGPDLVSGQVLNQRLTAGGPPEPGTASGGPPSEVPSGKGSRTKVPAGRDRPPPPARSVLRHGGGPAGCRVRREGAIPCAQQ